MDFSKKLIGLIIAFLICSPLVFAQIDFIMSQDIGSTGIDYGHNGTSDSLGNILLTGEFQNTINFPSGVTMTSQGNYDYFLVKFDKYGNALWKRTAGSGPGSNPERGYGVRFDNYGNIVTCGSFFVTTTWEGGGNPDITITAAGNLDGFIAKYDSAGKLLWVKPQASVAQVVTYKVAIDKSNNIIGCGYYGSATSTDTARFDTVTIKSVGSRDGFVAKYNQDGRIAWVRTMGGPTSSAQDMTEDVVVDPAGNVYVCGACVGAGNFNGIHVDCDTIDSWKNGLTPDAFVAKYSPDGDVIWAKKFGGHNSDIAYELALDNLGHLYVTGYFDSAAVFGSLGVITSNGEKGQDIFLAKMDTSGNALWVRTGGTAGVYNEYGYSVVVDKAANPWITGSFQQTASFNGTQMTSKGGEDIFWAEYNPSGDLLFLKRAGGTDLDKGLSSWWGLAGELYTTGRFRAIADFGSFNLTAVGGDDIFMSKLGSVVPVELSSFNSVVKGRIITLNWETKTELNSKQFEIERSMSNSLNSASSWIKIGIVNSIGNSLFPNKYNFTDKNLPAGAYKYRLKMVDLDGSFKYSNIIEVKIGIPETFNLNQNYPNPFNPATSISYQLPFDCKVQIEVFNITGQKVAEIVNQNQEAGYYNVVFEPGSKITSGVYIYRMVAVGKEKEQQFSSVKKMMIIK